MTVDEARSEILRWARKYLIGPDEHGQYQEALKFHLLRMNHRIGVDSQYLGYGWLLMWVRSAMHGDGTHIITPAAQHEFALARSVGPFDFLQGMSNFPGMSNWRSAFDAKTKLHTMSWSEDDGWVPQEIADMPSHSDVTEEAALTYLTGHGK